MLSSNIAFWSLVSQDLLFHFLNPPSDYLVVIIIDYCRLKTFGKYISKILGEILSIKKLQAISRVIKWAFDISKLYLKNNLKI